ncbi:glycosyltransferase family 4 protein [Candidatus Roizmanbacteria bacterium]|nr:glycosyltransferase family 4 protein [Candidatus Roizmanbacteria bacterium]
MSTSIYCFDPSISDEKSNVRGIGRYLQILKENFGNQWIFTQRLNDVPLDSVFINPFFNFLQFPPVMRRIAQKQIAVIHDLIPLKYPESFPIGLKGRLAFFLNKLALKNYDIIVTDSEVSKKDIIALLKISQEKVKVIYPYLLNIFTEKKQITSTRYTLPTTNYCLYVGDATWNKNLVNLAKAIKIINVTCVFVGKVFESKATDHPWQKELQEFLEEVKDDKRFIFAGFVTDEQLIGLYQNAKCNILVSRDEGFGFSYLEAASQSCPSILSDTSILHEISNDKGVLFAKPDNPHDIANAIGELYFNKDVGKKIGIEAARRAADFSPLAFKNEWQQLLQ